MTTIPRDEIDFSQFPSSDGQPMAETEPNLVQAIDLILQLKPPLEPRGHHVGGNLLIYWDPNDGWKHISPDVFVALHAGLTLRESWKTWIEGKFPEVVFEIASPSTQDRDIGVKVRLYAERGAREYYIFDPASRLNPRFRGYQLQGARMIAQPNPTGLSIVSPLLGLELRVIDGWLRVIDPATGQSVPLPEEERQMRLQAEAEARQAEASARQAEASARQAEASARQAEANARQAEANARQAETRADLAEQALQDAEARAAAAEARVQALLAELERRQSEGKPPPERDFPSGTP